MDSNEEYLDQLLKSLTEGNSSAEEDDGIGDLLNQFSEEPHSVPEDLISGLLGGSESAPENSVDDIMTNLSDEMPENPDYTVPEVPEIPETLEVPDEMDILETPEMSDETNISEILGMPEEADILETLGMPEEADISETLGMPGEVDISEMLGMSEEAEIPEIPEEAEAELPSAASRQESETEFSAGEGEEDDDLGSLLESLGAEGDEDVKEISDLLEKAEKDEPIVDMMDSLPPESNEEVEESSSKKGKKKKKERVKKEKKPRRSRKKQEIQDMADSPAEGASGDIDSLINGMQQETETAAPEETTAAEKKQGFWGKLLNTLTQEEEDAEDPADLISDENGAIMEQLDKEDKSKGKKKKKADKKGKGKNAADTGEDEELEESSNDKKKKKKEKKPKKEKPAASVEELLPGKKLSIKKILPVVLVALVFCSAYVIVSNLYIGHVNKQRAEEAYYAGDYLECYGLLFGQDLNESQALIYHKSELALQMERIKGNYQRLMLEGKELEALDYLVQSVCRREEFYLEAQEWGCLDMVEQTFTGLIGLLNANYSLDEARAMEIAALQSDVDYTIALLSVLEESHSPGPAGEEAGEQEQPTPYEDLLPEEEEIPDTEFVDTIG